MKRLAPRTLFVLLLDGALLAACFLHIPYVKDRPLAPFLADTKGNRLLVDSILVPAACPDLMVGDELISWNEIRFFNDDDPEFLADYRRIGDTVQVAYSRAGVVRVAEVTLPQHYGLSHIVVILFSGVVTWLLAVLVIVARPGEHTAVVLHWSLMSMAIAVMTGWGATPAGDPWVFTNRTLYFLSFTGVATFFVYFTLLFPRESINRGFRYRLLIFAPAYLLGAVTCAYLLNALVTGLPEDNDRFRFWNDVYHLLFLGYVATAITHFVRSYRRTVSPVERKKLEWILLGLVLGPTPYLFLILIPELSFVLGKPLVPEQYTLMFLVIIPITFAISFVKYHILNIRIVLNRTTVYGIVIGGLVLLYVILVGAATKIVGEYTDESIAAGAILVALLFEPARRRVQYFVDRQFFRVKFDLWEAQKLFVEEMKQCVDIKQFAQLLVQRTDELIPVDRIGFFALKRENRLYTVAQKNYDLFERRTISFKPEDLRTELNLPVAVDDMVEPGIVHESADERVFHRWRMVLVFPMRSMTGDFLGFLVLGHKKAGTRFSSEEVDLLNDVTNTAGLEIERIKLQQRLVQEQAEARQLRELNEIKSDFVSYVSHELRNPIASIMLFADLSEARMQRRDKKAREFMEIIGGEAGRLERMVATILDSTKIERGVMNYTPQKADLGVIADEVLRVMKYQLGKHQFAVKDVGISTRKQFPIQADPDAVKRAMINIIDNAIKYSTSRRYLKVSVTRKGNWAIWSAEDRGLGMSPETVQHVFDRFYRDPGAEKKIEGVGLGLPLVKHIVEWHGGSVHVESREGRGTQFRLSFPLRAKDHGS